MNYRQKYLSASLLGIAALVGSACPGWAATAPDLGAAATFAVLGSSTATCTGVSTITGDVGVSPGSAVTGFPPCTVGGGAIHLNDAVAIAAQAAATTAYNDLAGQACDTDLTGQDLGGLTLTSGVYCFSSSAQLTGTLNLVGQGPWIFQIGSTLTTASNSSVLVNGDLDCSGLDVFWQVGSSATLGTGTQFVGNILASTSITLTTGANVSGSALALNGAVTMDTNNVSVCSGGGGKSHSKCNQGVGNGPEGCDPGNSNQGFPFRSNDELGGVPGNPGRKGGNK